MGFLSAVIESIFKIAVIGAVAFGGICLGAFLRKKKDSKIDKE